MHIERTIGACGLASLATLRGMAVAVTSPYVPAAILDGRAAGAGAHDAP